MNILYNEDYRQTVKRKDVKFDYVFTVPPDFEELGWKPEVNRDEYYSFLYNCFNKLIEKTNTLTIAITDRKYNSHLEPKHWYILSYFLGNNFKLISHKIWKKTDKVNLYRLTYTHIMTFSTIKPKQNHPKYYETDVYEVPEEKYEGYPYGIPVAIVERLVANFTQENATVYDPFSGSGSTMIACKKLNRHFIGSEINTDYYNLSKKRLNQQLL